MRTPHRGDCILLYNIINKLLSEAQTLKILILSKSVYIYVQVHIQSALSSGRFAGSKSQGVGRWAPASTRFIAFAPNFPFYHFYPPCFGDFFATGYDRIFVLISPRSPTPRIFLMVRGTVFAIQTYYAMRPEFTNCRERSLNKTPWLESRNLSRLHRADLSSQRARPERRRSLKCIHSQTLVKCIFFSLSPCSKSIHSSGRRVFYIFVCC